MKFVVKYFPEITIKSKPVRKRLVGQLRDNLRSVLRDIDPDIVVDRGWDKLEVSTALSEPQILARLVEAMRNTAGVTYILEVEEHPLCPLDEITDKVLPVYRERLAGRTFAVRCKRVGKHEYLSLIHI